MSNTIIYDKYDFDIKLDEVDTKINIKLIDTELLDIYECSIKEADIYVKPIKKFYSMIEKALSRELNYNIIITEKKGQIICSFAYNNEMVDIEETVIFTKVNTQKTKELLLIDRIKELTEIATPEFGYRNFGEIMTFNIDSKVLDFRQYDDFILHGNYGDYNKFKKVKKIITNVNIYNNMIFRGCQCKVIYHEKFIFANYKTYMCPVHKGEFNLDLDSLKPSIRLNVPYVYMPSVTEVEVHCSPYPELEREFTKFGSLPNLEKLVMIHRDNTGLSAPFLDIHSIITNSPNKKLKHIIIKNMSTWIKPDTVDKAKLFAQVNNIKLEII